MKDSPSVMPKSDEESFGTAQDKPFGTAQDKPFGTAQDKWQKILTPEQYRVLRLKGTERPFTGIYYDSKEKGVYRCAACGSELFSSETKFDSGTGWPSFTCPVADGNVELRPDSSLGMSRTEVVCRKCGGHLGHVFDDGPQPTGKRFCINSIALQLEKRECVE